MSHPRARTSAEMADQVVTDNMVLQSWAPRMPTVPSSARIGSAVPERPASQVQTVVEVAVGAQAVARIPCHLPTARTGLVELEAALEQAEQVAPVAVPDRQVAAHSEFSSSEQRLL